MGWPRNPSLTRWHLDRNDHRSVTCKIYPYELPFYRLNTGRFSEFSLTLTMGILGSHVLGNALLLMDRKLPETPCTVLGSIRHET